LVRQRCVTAMSSSGVSCRGAPYYAGGSRGGGRSIARDMRFGLKICVLDGSVGGCSVCPQAAGGVARLKPAGGEGSTTREGVMGEGPGVRRCAAVGEGVGLMGCGAHVVGSGRVGAISEEGWGGGRWRQAAASGYSECRKVPWAGWGIGGGRFCTEGGGRETGSWGLAAVFGVSEGGGGQEGGGGGGDWVGRGASGGGLFGEGRRLIGVQKRGGTTAKQKKTTGGGGVK